MTTSDAIPVDEITFETEGLTSGQKIKLIVESVGRTLLGLLFVWVVLMFVPEDINKSLWIPTLAIGTLVVIYAWYFRLQLKRIHKAKYPQIQAAEALILVAAMFLAIFAMIYNLMSLNSPESFTENLNRFDAFYFAMTVLATVGFGDITPVTVAARSVSMIQMAIDIAFIAVAVKIVSGAATKAISSRTQSEQQSVRIST